MQKDKRFLEAYNLLKRYNQEHLLTFYDELAEADKKRLLEQVFGLEFSFIPEWIEKYVKQESAASIPENFEPAPSYPARPQDGDQAQKYEEARKVGRDLIAGGKVAAFVVAGGQGTRLGFDGPKGDFPISPVRNKTLFELFAEQILAASKKYGVNLPWYVMTSELNHRPTINLFEKNDYYGLNKSDVFIFRQGTLPNFRFDGRIFLADKATIAKSPDGHGGSLKALYASGAVSDMKSRGVEYISYFQVDNPLITIFDPLFIGLHAMDKSQMSSKALLKAYPTEKVGNFCLVDGKVTVIEYSDLPEDLAQKKDEDGSLMFELGSIAIHIISRTFVEELNYQGFGLPIHRAVKKIPHVDHESGEKVDPQDPNGVKLETFVFDALPLAETSIILETQREEEFAPVKNAEGNDSPATSRQLMMEQAARWLEQAGISVPRNGDGSLDCELEIAASFADGPEEVAGKKDQIGEISPGDTVCLE